MKIAFTICSNNYLAQAKTLGDSLLNHSPDYRLFIFLVDTLSKDVEYTDFNAFEIIPAEALFPGTFHELWQRYNIIELNTCIKPTCFKYLFQRHPEAEFLFYFDPDIMLFDSLKGLENEGAAANFLLTPHVIHPIPLDNRHPLETLFLNYGLYNLGFFGVRRSAEGFRLLDWWEQRTLTMGFYNPAAGIFVDQLWLNLAPLFFEGVKIVKDYAYNTGPWNLHERYQIKKDRHHYVMQDGTVLCFYHFSGYKHTAPETIAKHYQRIALADSAELTELYTVYRQRLLENKIEQLSKIPCSYVEMRRDYVRQNTPTSRKLKNFLKNRVYSLNDWYNNLFSFRAKTN